MSNLIAVNNNFPVAANGSMDAYISYVNSIPLLTEQEEYDLAQKWRLNEDVEAAKSLVLSHLRLVVSISRNYLGYGLPFADIVQEGTIGLMKAVKKFDATRKVRLVTFAIHWIKAEINEFVIKNWRIVKTVTTKAQRKLFFNLRSQRADIGNLSDTEANKIAQELDVSKEDVIDMNMRLSGTDIALIGENDESAPIDWLADDEHTPELMLERKAHDRLQTEGLKYALERLPDERSRRIIEMRHLVDDEEKLTLHELAAELSISAERVRQIEEKALQKMRGYLEEFIAA